jgi:hypothetical protein
MMPDDFSLRDLSEPPEASYEAVRRRVMGEIRRQKRVRNAMRMLAVAAACVVLAVAGLLVLRPGAGAVAPPILARAPGAPELASIVHRAPAQRRRTLSLMAHAHAPKQELVVRMQTDDPSVVIIWMVD